VKQQRVVAYITRVRDGRVDLLVFAHRDFPEAGIQVPAGRLEPREELEAGLRREIEEEAGLSNIRILKELEGFEDHYPSQYENHGFHVVLEGDVADEWVHVVLGHGDDAGLTFRYRWEPITPDLHLFERPHPLLMSLAEPMEKP
jgi:8-oxo-dGTP diphosphatase